MLIHIILLQSKSSVPGCFPYRKAAAFYSVVLMLVFIRLLRTIHELFAEREPVPYISIVQTSVVVTTSIQAIASCLRGSYLFPKQAFLEEFLLRPL